MINLDKKPFPERFKFQYIRPRRLVPSCTGTCIRVLVFALMVFAAAGPGSAQSYSSRTSVPLPLLFLGNETLPPMIYSRNGKVVGVVAELAHALPKRMDRPVEIQAMNWGQAQQLVLEGRADALLQINQSPERLAYFDFSEALRFRNPPYSYPLTGMGLFPDRICADFGLAWRARAFQSRC